MPKLNSFKTLALAATAAVTSNAVLTAVPATAHHHKTAAKTQPNIVETAMSTGVHGTLVAAVKAAGLVDTLSNNGPFTIFAPTDTAFAKLPAGTVGDLVKPENKGTLTNILVYHAVQGSVSAADLITLIEQHDGSATIPTLAGQSLTARLSGNTVVITDAAGRTAAVTQTDVQTSNGVIHVTDGVFLPG